MTSCHFASQSSSWVILLIHHQNTTPGLTWHDVLHLLLHSSFLYHSLILFLGATALAAPLGPEDVLAVLPDSIQNTFQRHKLKIYSGPSGLHQLSYSAFKTAKDFLISSKLTVPPHMRWTYSGVMPARSIEQERISLSINCRRRATNSSFTVLFIILSMHLRLHLAYLKVILIRVEMVTVPSQLPRTS